MRTVGIDLSSQIANTGICTIEWSKSGASVQSLVSNARDDDIVAAVADADAYGIDTPFGWPARFVDMIAKVNMAGRARTWTKKWRDQMRFRETDRIVSDITGRWPPSVSSDRTAITAMRCQGLLRHLQVSDRSGDGRAFEVYPDVALHRWGLPTDDFRQKKATTERKNLIAALQAGAPWLDLGRHRTLCIMNDDALDAVICALIARAAQIGLVQTPEGPEQLQAARREGWIAIPHQGSLARLRTRPRSKRKPA